MKIFFPYYYKDFRCIAERCKNSCCIGWEIGIDDETMAKYSSLNGELGDDIRSHICMDDSVISMGESGRCPFLTDSGLCRIISRMGEEWTSHICREHPRFYHIAGGRVEGGIGAVCEEACRIILSSDDFAEFTEVDRVIDLPDMSKFDILTHRDRLYSLLLSDMAYREKLDAIMGEYNIPDPTLDTELWLGALSELEYLDDSHRSSFGVGNREGRAELHRYFERFLAYLIFRHVSIAENYDDLRARIGFCILLTLIFENMTSGKELDFEAVVDMARIISEEIEYSEDNTDSLIMEMASLI